MINKQILNYFDLPGDDYQMSSYGSGHINVTNLVTGKKNKFILQKINDKIFPDVDGLMRNVSSVCDFNTEQVKKQGGDVKRCLSLVRAKDGASYVKTDEGCFRVYNFIENTVAINMPLSAEHFGEGGACFAEFARNLAGFDASTLTDVIPHFHDTVRRVENLEKSAEKNIAGRFSEVEELYDFVLSRKSAAGVVLAAEKLRKYKTAFQDGCVFVLLLAVDFSGTAGRVINIAGLLLFAVATVLTIWSGISYVVKNRAVLRDTAH